MDMQDISMIVKSAIVYPENKIKIVPIVASNNKPVAHKTPIAAQHHKVAAVLSPLILLPSFNITPAPKNPFQKQLGQQF